MALAYWAQEYNQPTSQPANNQPVHHHRRHQTEFSLNNFTSANIIIAMVQPTGRKTKFNCEKTIKQGGKENSKKAANK